LNAAVHVGVGGLLPQEGSALGAQRLVGEAPSTSTTAAASSAGGVAGRHRGDWGSIS
jgi:hypothetical protein